MFLKSTLTQTTDTYHLEMEQKRDFLNKVQSLQELEIWASNHHYTNDPEVNLKRIELLATRSVKTSEHCTQQQPAYSMLHHCHLCNRTFTQNKSLLRHVRTVHDNQRFQCEQCKKSYSRLDALHSHSCQQSTLKRKQSSSGPAAKRPCLQSGETSPPSRFDTCIWCGHFRCLLPGKLFCEYCSHNGRECKGCRRPLGERFFSNNVHECDSCVRRRERYQARHVNQYGGGQRSALEGTLRTSTLTPNQSNDVDILKYLADEETNIVDILHAFLLEKKGMKWFLTLKLSYIKYDENNQSHLAEPVLRTTNFWVTNLAEVDEQLAEAFQKLYSSAQEFQAEGSGWILDHIIHLEVNTAEYVPLSASSFIPLPNYLKSKKAIINIQNNDQKCFVWSILAALHPLSFKDHANRVSNYVAYESELNMCGIDMPVPLSQISKFEKQNNISVNVYGYDEKDGVFPLHVSNFMSNKIVDLLLLSQEEKRHFCLIRNFSRLMGDRTKHCRTAFYCRHCLHGFTRKDLLENHAPFCYEHKMQKIKMPEGEKAWVKFKNIQNQLRVPYVVYCDFESITKEVCEQEAQKSLSTSIYQKHEPSGFCYKVVSSDSDNYQPAVVYRGPNVIGRFIDCLLKEEKTIREKLSESFPIDMSEADEKAFQAADRCHICHQTFGENSIKVRDHDHLMKTHNYRGAAHQACNLQFKFKKSKQKKSHDKGQEKDEFYLPVIFHNLSNYDSHLLLKHLDKTYKGKLQCIAQNLEKYISFSLGRLRFIDSFKFLQTSLDTLVNNMVSDCSEEIDKTKVINLNKCNAKFKHLFWEFDNDEQRKLLLKKGVYPYDFMNEESKFMLNHLPKQDEFYNRLTQSSLSHEDYVHAQQVWSKFHIQNMGEYHDLYMKSDVLLLADVFEDFRDMCLENYELDSAHYYTLPGFGWDAMLKMGDVELELLTDVDQHLMLEAGLRGGISCISTKYVSCNNHLTKLKEFNPNVPTSFLMYLDSNNLYGWAMSQALPERDFHWVENIDEIDVMSIAPDAEFGFIFEVDLQYPSHLHELHNDYPLAPEPMIVTDDMLSKHSKQLKEKLNLKGKPVKKLVPNLLDKTNYVLHYRNLQFYLDHGMVLTKIHRAIQFRQTAWLRPFIDYNTEKRKQAKNETEKAFFKLLNNSCFGRSMMNVRKHVNVELVNSAKRLKKLCAKPTFDTFRIFNPDLAAVHLKRATLTLNQPIYAGFSILDLSKLVMYDFHYNFIKPKYGEKSLLCFTDTDSLCYKIETPDLYADIGEHRHLFDTSNYPPKHSLFSKTNAKVLAKFKDELGGCIMEEFVGLRPKLYSFSFEVKEEKIETDHDNDEAQMVMAEKHTAKGVSKTVIKRQLRHELYKQCLFDKTQFRHEMNQIRSFQHQLYTIAVNKVSLSPFDDKRYVLDDGIHTLAHGHYKIKSYTNC